MSDIYVHDFSYALGERKISLDESEKLGLLLSKASQYYEAGFSFHRVCEEQTTPYDLAKRAALPLLDKVQGATSLIYSTCLTLNGNLGSFKEFEKSRDVKHLMNYPASHLQADMGLHDAAVFGLNQQACTSMLGSLRLAKALLMSESHQEKILCVTADRFPQGAHYEQAYNVISDGAAACIVSRKAQGYKILASHGITNGALAMASDDETVGSYFSYTHKLLTELCEMAKISIDKIDWIVPQNTNVNAWLILSRLLGIEAEKVHFKTVSEVGHIISSDNVVNLVDLENRGLVKSGQTLLLFMAGFGLNWQATLLQKV